MQAKAESFVSKVKAFFPLIEMLKSKWYSDHVLFKSMEIAQVLFDFKDWLYSWIIN